jgi:hypothetical protein
MRLYHWTYGCRLDSIREHGLMATPPLFYIYTPDRDTRAQAGLMNIVWLTCDPGSPKWIAGQRPDVRLTVEVPDDQRLMPFQRWFKDRPDRELIGTEPWNAAGCDDWFFLLRRHRRGRHYRRNVGNYRKGGMAGSATTCGLC